jgi:hypothetical protein
VRRRGLSAQAAHALKGARSGGGARQAAMGVPGSAAFQGWDAVKAAAQTKLAQQQQPFNPASATVQGTWMTAAAIMPVVPGLTNTATSGLPLVPGAAPAGGGLLRGAGTATSSEGALGDATSQYSLDQLDRNLERATALQEKHQRDLEEHRARNKVRPVRFFQYCGRTRTHCVSHRSNQRLALVPTGYHEPCGRQHH